MSRAIKGISDYIKLCTSQIIFFEYGYPHFKTQTTIWNEWALCNAYKQKLHKTTCSEWKEMLYNDVRFQMA